MRCGDPVQPTEMGRAGVSRVGWGAILAGAGARVRGPCVHARQGVSRVWVLVAIAVAVLLGALVFLHNEGDSGAGGDRQGEAFSPDNPTQQRTEEVGISDSRSGKVPPVVSAEPSRVKDPAAAPTAVTSGEVNSLSAAAQAMSGAVPGTANVKEPRESNPAVDQASVSDLGPDSGEIDQEAPMRVPEDMPQVIHHFRVDVLVTPADADIYADGRYKGAGSSRLYFAHTRGVVVIEVRREGYRPWVRRVPVDQDLTYEVALLPDGQIDDPGNSGGDSETEPNGDQ